MKVLTLDQVKEALNKHGIGYADYKGDIQIAYASDIAMLKLSDTIGISNGQDGLHQLDIGVNYPKKPSAAVLKLEKFAFYKYDCDSEPVFELEGWCMIIITEDQIYLKVV